MYVMKDIAHPVFKGFRLSFYVYVVRVREKMAGKVFRHPDSVFERLATKNI